MASDARKKVYVGMSGGVDSSVSAALLKSQGFDVTGVFIKVWQPDWYECTWKEDRLDAMRVAAHLEIPLITLDLEKEYKKEVVDHMVSEYKAGRTPNPDVMCNKHVKFGGFFDYAMRSGADFIATGHYASSLKGELFAGKDAAKDQSYFLWNLTAKQLSKIIFPVGSMKKHETRKLARRLKLPVADKKDSQGLCFIGKVSIKEFLSHFIEARKGAVKDESGNVIGSHDGALFLTLGERHGFTVFQRSPDEKPYYVVERDLTENTVTVSHRSSDGGLSAEKNICILRDTNWISAPPVDGAPYLARIRHLGELQRCFVESIKPGQAAVRFELPVIAASGQSIVIYDGPRCVGGGIVSGS